MNYYEEFGLTASSSVEEIRQAYKSLARLLHPDHQHEEQLRKVAELQMMRLNQILEVLSDPLRREEYDASIRPATPPSPVREQPIRAWTHIRMGRLRIGPFRFDLSTIVWSAALVAAAIGFSFTLLYFQPGSALPVYQGNAPATLTSDAPVAGTPPVHERVPPSRGEGRTKRLVNAGNKIETPKNAPPPAPAAMGLDIPMLRTEEAKRTPIAASPVAAVAPEPPALENISKPANSLSDGLIGTWLYAKSGTGGGTIANLTYRPEYIEMVVKAEESGKISGRYLGRFQVPDQPISSEVRFTFEGAVAEGAVALPWHGGSGAEGQIRMKLLSSGSVEVTWYTTRFGASRTLASGSAVLRHD